MNSVLAINMQAILLVLADPLIQKDLIAHHSKTRADAEKKKTGNDLDY